MEDTRNDYDVIIIGAGPAGLSCAHELAKSNLKILILEMKEIIGPKVCAGGLTRKDLRHIGIPDELLDFRFREIRIHTPLLSIKEDDEFAMISTVDRKKFADWQLKDLTAKNNVEIRTGCKVTAIDKDKVTVNETVALTYKYLVGADGSFSPVRKFLGIKTEAIAVAIQYIVPTDKYEQLEFFVDAKLFKSWYAWIFPHRGYASIGCMCDPRHLSAKKLQQNFKHWLGKNHIDISKGKYEGYAINYDYQGYAFGNVFLAGDAAGLASGLTGEGIYQAIVSGEEVARTILDEKYESSKMKQLLETKRLHQSAMDTVIRLGPLRNLFFAFLATLLKNKKIAYRLIKYVS